MSRPWRVAFVCSHPIQYLAPWFAQVAREPSVEVTVLYGTLSGQTRAADDRDFGQKVRWDVDLLSGYRYVELASHTPWPGLDRFWGVLSGEAVRHFLSERFDAVVILGWNYALYPVALAAARFARIPVILRGDSVRYADADETEARLSPKDRLSARAKRAVLARYVSLCHAGLAVSTGNRRLLLHAGMPAERIFFAPYAVEDRRFRLPDAELAQKRHDVRAALGCTGDKPVVLFCGKLSPVKAPELLLSAFARLRQTGYDAALWFCGDGELRESLVREVARRSIPDVSFLGFRNQTELPGLYAASDLMCVPSHRETFAMVVPEAMHAGRPAVVSDRVGCAEDLVWPGKTGLRFPAGNADALCACLSVLCDPTDGPARRQAMGEAARACMEHFTYKETTQGLLSALFTLPKP